MMKKGASLFGLAAIFGAIASAELPLDPQCWKLTFPKAGPGGNALEILNPEFSAILNGEQELEEDLQEYLSFSDQEIVLTSEYTGVTTSSDTSYSRTELREMKGAEQHNWTLNGERRLECRMKVSGLKGGANKLFIMQIHGKEPESKPLLKVIWEKGYIRLLSKSGPKLKNLRKQQKYTEVGTDQWFTCAIHASPESLSIHVNGEEIESFGPEVLAHWPKENTYYFKAGNYLQHDNEGAGATVSFSSIRLTE